MQWLNKVVDEVIARQPEGEVIIESGSSPSGTYHFGHMRELMTCDAILLELQRRGRQARHIQFVDDLDSLRKIPVNVPADYEKYLGYPICDIPAPDGSDQSYADYFLQGLVDACKALNIEVEFVRSHERYRSGWMVPAIERALDHVAEARRALETISGRKLDEHWTPIQIMENGRLKNRKFVDINKDDKSIHYEDSEGNIQVAHYDKGEVKLDWRLDWPGRWWLQNVAVEPSGRDHMTKGSSYDTGVQIVRDVYGGEAPIAVAYDFINMAGDTKKMSASKGTGLDALEAAELMPAEVMRFYVFRSPPLKRLYFDPVNGVVQVMDEFAAFAARGDRNEPEEQLLDLSTRGLKQKTVSRVPFSHLVASYQASLKDVGLTLDVLRRTEYARVVDEDAEIIKTELQFIQNWLDKRAPEEVKFNLRENVDIKEFSEQEQAFLRKLGDKVSQAPEDAEGAWFHDAIYALKDELGLDPKDMFGTLYRALIGKTSGPRAGYFLSILPRDFLVRRLKLEA
ncbi:MAG TPA: lysine--tRNA ligase [Candidatus Saccharimonadales bacterium]|nr:lysine--tRNA ligase [Candidatus Saccharimonadales bacterium]